MSTQLMTIHDLLLLVHEAEDRDMALQCSVSQQKSRPGSRQGSVHLEIASCPDHFDDEPGSTAEQSRSDHLADQLRSDHLTQDPISHGSKA